MRANSTASLDCITWLVLLLQQDLPIFNDQICASCYILQIETTSGANILYSSIHLSLTRNNLNRHWHNLAFGISFTHSRPPLWQRSKATTGAPLLNFESPATCTLHCREASISEPHPPKYITPPSLLQHSSNTPPWPMPSWQLDNVTPFTFPSPHATRVKNRTSSCEVRQFRLHVPPFARNWFTLLVSWGKDAHEKLTRHPLAPCLAEGNTGYRKKGKEEQLA